MKPVSSIELKHFSANLSGKTILLLCILSIGNSKESGLLNPNEPARDPRRDAIHHWAQLEGKSESMAEALLQNLEPNRRTASAGNRLAIGCLLVLLAGLIVGRVWIEVWSESPLPPAGSSDSLAQELPRFRP